MKHRNFLRMITVVGALQLGYSACGKKEPQANNPDLSMRNLNTSAAEAEAVGVNGPLELTLRIFKTKIKSDKESLWYQVRLRNIGQEEIRIFDAPFLAPTRIDMHGSVGVSLQVTGPDGKQIKKRFYLGGNGGGVLVPGSPSWPIQEGDRRDEATKTRAIDTMWADRAILRERAEYEEALRRGGTSQEEIIRKSLQFDEEHPQSEALQKRRPSPHIALKPGAAVTTIPWTDRHVSDPERQSQFSEFAAYSYTQPGKYRIKATFDARSRGWVVEYDKKHGIPPRIDDVFVETKTIEFEVLP